MQRARAMLKPFRLGVWLKMGFIGWLAGELVSFNFGAQVPSFPAGFPPGAGHPSHPRPQIPSNIPWEHVIPFLVVLGALVLITVLLFAFLFSRFRFILFDCALTGEIRIGRGWNLYSAQGTRYFGFWLLLSVLSLSALVLICGVPLANAFHSGVFDRMADDPGPLFAFIGSLFLGLFLFGLVMYVVGTFAKDFLVPLMALDNLSVSEAWAALLRMMKAQPGSFAAYLGMKLVLYIAMGILLTVCMIIVVLILMVPTVIVAVAVAASLKGGATLTAGVFGAMMISALMVIGILFCVLLLATAPFSAFFASYSLYFMGGRYPKLGAILWPDAPPPLPEAQGLAPVPAT